MLLAQAFSTSCDQWRVHASLRACSCVLGWGVCVFRDLILHVSRLGLPNIGQ